MAGGRSTPLPQWPGQGADTPVPVPVPVPDLSGDGDGASVPDLPGGGDAPPSPSPICPESGTLPRPRPRFAEIGDQAVVLEYPKGVEAFAQVWSHNSQITRRTGQLCPDTPTFPIWLAIAPSTNDAFRQLEPSWGRWLKLDPLFAGCLPSKPLALTGARQMAQETTPCTSRRVCCARARP